MCEIRELLVSNWQRLQLTWIEDGGAETLLRRIVRTPKMPCLDFPNDKNDVIKRLG